MPLTRVRSRIWFFTLFFAASAASAEGVGDWVKIRQDSDDKNLIEKPARFQLTDPDDGKTTWASDVAVIVESDPAFLGWGQLEGGINFEYHRQTAPSNEQDTLQTGLSGNLVLGDVSTDVLTSWLPLNFQYKRDREKRTDGLQVTIDWVPIVKTNVVRFGHTYAFAGNENGPDEQDLLRVRLQPTVGIEYEGIFDSPNQGPTGRIWRANVRAEIVALPLAGRALQDDRIQLFANASYWRVLDASSERNTPNGESLDLFEVGIRYIVRERRTPSGAGTESTAFPEVSLAVSYLDGEDPRKSKPSQEYWQLALEIKL